MKKLLFVLPLVGAISACETQNPSAMSGALAGAAVGAVASDSDDRAKGAILGGLVGAAAGAFVGRAGNGQCIYETSAGERYTSACP